MAAPGSVDEYFDGLPAEGRVAMETLRATIRAAAPAATELISYRMPAFKHGGRILVYYAAFADHCSIYPATAALREVLGDELSPHLSGKGTIRFEADQPIPVELVKRIVEVRLEENAARRKG